MMLTMRSSNVSTFGIGIVRSRTAVLFMVFSMKSAMVFSPSPARIPGNVTDNYKVCAGGYESDFIEEVNLGSDS